jgi:membrane-bound lytic murein transglycosylase C
VSILLAIIETESSFNPRATSSVPAFGLMQLVPRTAGIDAYDLVYGEKKIVTPEYLYRERNNLELGTAYFYLVSNHYLKGIEDELSRFYCAIASYNTGIGNVTRTFGHNTIKGSVEKINTLTPEQVLQFLMLHLPATETKNYLKKILARKSRYEKYDKA